nr:MAG TPA: hypothetical protein [Caudoviricetes sp.]
MLSSLPEALLSASDHVKLSFLVSVVHHLSPSL